MRAPLRHRACSKRGGSHLPGKSLSQPRLRPPRIASSPLALLCPRLQAQRRDMERSNSKDPASTTKGKPREYRGAGKRRPCDARAPPPQSPAAAQCCGPATSALWAGTGGIRGPTSGLAAATRQRWVFYLGGRDRRLARPACASGDLKDEKNGAWSGSWWGWDGG